MVEGAGFEPAKLSRQIYSLIPLAAREPLQDLNIVLAQVSAHHANLRKKMQAICMLIRICWHLIKRRPKHFKE